MSTFSSHAPVPRRQSAHALLRPRRSPTPAPGSLVAMLLETLTKQEEEQFEDDGVWNLAMAGATCLDLVARLVRDDIVDIVMPFVQRHVASANWREREAAVFAFGSILDGPSAEKISSVFTPESFKFLLNMLKDADHKVRDSTAWTLGRIIEFLAGVDVKAPLITPELLPAVLALLLECLQARPRAPACLSQDLPRNVLLSRALAGGRRLRARQSPAVAR